MKTVLTEKHNFIESAKVFFSKVHCMSNTIETKDKCKVVLNLNPKKIEKWDTRILYLKMFEKKGYIIYLYENYFVVKINHTNEYYKIYFNDYEIEVDGITFSFLTSIKYLQVWDLTNIKTEMDILTNFELFYADNRI